MSCGSSTCNPTRSNISALSLEPASRLSWLAKMWARIGVTLVKIQKRQFAIELEKARQRGILMGLDDRLLADIGLTREQAMREGRKRFWD
jgi:uncharacterized protein YjiS (DUF1127 family)